MSLAHQFQRASYPLKKQLIWQQLDNIWKHDIVLLGQANNLSTPKMADLRHKLRQQNLFLRFPKPGVLRAYLRQSRWSALEPAVVGLTFCAVSKGEPSSLRAALETMQAERNLVLLGGKIYEEEFTIEGFKDAVVNLGGLEMMRSQMLALLQSPALALTQACTLAPSHLAANLQAHADSLFQLEIPT